MAKAKDKDKMTAFNSAIGYANLTNGYELIRIGQISLRCRDVSHIWVIKSPETKLTEKFEKVWDKFQIPRLVVGYLVFKLKSCFGPTMRQ